MVYKCNIDDLSVINNCLYVAGEEVKFCDFDNGTDDAGDTCVILTGETKNYRFYVYFPSESDFWKIENPDASDVAYYAESLLYY